MDPYDEAVGRELFRGFLGECVFHRFPESLPGSKACERCDANPRMINRLRRQQKP